MTNPRLNLSNSKIVVIGGAGFIGSHLVEQLLAEPVREIVVFDNFSRGSRENLSRAVQDPRVKLFEGDIIHPDLLDTALQGADGVFHFAALWLLHCHEYPRSAFKVNIEGTFNVLEACKRHGVKRLVYSSSASVYGDALVCPMTEDHPYNNRTFYGATKIAGEHMCRAFHARYGLNYVGLRYMNVYGPRQDYKGAYTSVIMKILDRLDRNEPPIVYGDGTQTYDFVYVGDTAHANLCAMKSEANDSFYNVGSGVGLTIRELAGLLLDITGSKLEIKYEPSGPTFVTKRIGSTAKAEKELSFKIRTELQDGLRRLIEWRNSQPGTRSYKVPGS